MAFFRISLLLLFESLTISALHRLGSIRGFGVHWSDLLNSSTRTEDAIASALRLITLLIAYWLLMSSAAYVAARLTALPAAIRAAERTAMPVIRRTVDRALAVSLTVGALVSPATAFAQTSTTPPPVQQLYEPTAAGLADEAEALVVVDDGIIIPPGATVPPTKPSLLDAGTTVPTTLPYQLLFDGSVDSHVVREGDNLWTIALEHLKASGVSNPTEAVVAAYWIEVISANLDALESGDPDLIFPGEKVTLPPIAP